MAWAETIKDMIEAAENGRIDAMISEIENMNVKLVNGNLQSSFYRLTDPVFKINLFTPHLTTPQCLKILNEANQPAVLLRRFRQRDFLSRIGNPACSRT